MAIDYERLLALKIPDTEQTYTHRDVILYNLSVGFGEDPLAADQLPFVYERNLRVAPTMAVVLAHPGFWVKNLDSGIDWVKVVHSDQALTLHKPLPAAATVVGHTRVVDIIDKGAGKGAFVRAERVVSDKASGEALCTVVQTMYCRGDGGFGGPARAVPPPHAIPERTPDLQRTARTSIGLALLYRLNGDWNPLHADPAVARAAGFDRPILHGLATYGIATRAITETACAGDVSLIREIDGRFTSPVFPGETLRTDIWQDGRTVSFRTTVVERNVVAIDRGKVLLAG